MGDAEMRLKSQPSSGWLAESSLKRSLKISFKKTLLHYKKVPGCPGTLISYFYL
jgi:hypothetical protein